VVTPMVSGGITLCADALLFFCTSRLGNLWLMLLT
jgi:hypothetical protein